MERSHPLFIFGRLTIAQVAMTLALMGPGCFAQAPSLQTIRIVALYPHLPIVIAQDQGIFTKYGLDVQIENVSSSDILRERLASGKADLAHAAVDNGVAMVESAKVEVAIVMGGEGSVNEVIAQPGTHAISDLRGRTVIVDAPNTAYALQLKKILLMGGLKAGKDYDIKPVGGTPLRLQAMREHKEYAASILGPPTSIQAKSAGFVTLGNTLDLIGPYQATGAFTLRTWAHDHSELLERYLAAYIEGQRWLLAPENKSQVMTLIKKQWHLSEEEANWTYELIQGHAWYQADARLDPDAFSTVLKLRAELEGQWGGHAPVPTKYYDPTYYDKALARIRRP